MDSLGETALEACAREPIHLSGAIQPHGWLVSCVLPDWTVRHASANIAALFDVEPQALVGESLRDYIVDDLLHAVADTIGLSDPGAPPQRAAAGNIGPLAQLCDIGVHVADGLVHLEIEPQPNRSRERTPTVVAQNMISRVANATDMVDFHQRTAEQVRQLTGYDRVMVYRFRHDDSGEVVAESCASGMEPYLGLRFPASDIPVQARTLYLHNRLRVIPDVGYVPVPIVPPVNAAGLPLDLSQHALRSVSPIHVEYLRNMGVAASMSISILSGGRLWGLIACHHRAPRAVPPGVRAAADLFGMFVSMRVSAREQEDAVANDEAAREVRDALGLRLAATDDFAAGLRDALPHLRQALPCDGVALLVGGDWLAEGRAADAAELPRLRLWLAGHDGTQVASTYRAADWAGATAHPGGLAGILAIPLGGVQGDWILYFRSEQLEDVRWAGDPAKPAIETDDGRRIAPRRSFASWRETVRGQSTPWTDADRRAADRVRLLLGEQRRRALEDAYPGTVADLDAFRRRHTLREQKSRLEQLSALLEGLVHVDDREAARLGERIAELELELRALMQPETGERGA